MPVPTLTTQHNFVFICFLYTLVSWNVYFCRRRPSNRSDTDAATCHLLLATSYHLDYSPGFRQMFCNYGRETRGETLEPCPMETHPAMVAGESLARPHVPFACQLRQSGFRESARDGNGPHRHCLEERDAPRLCQAKGQTERDGRGGGVVWRSSLGCLAVGVLF